MVLESVFGSPEKGVSLDKFPSPPTTREMLEDIDNITQDDPILAFTRILLQKGTGETDTTVPELPTPTESPPVPDVLQNEEFSCDWLIDSLAVSIVRNASPKSAAACTLKNPINARGMSSNAAAASTPKSPISARGMSSNAVSPFSPKSPISARRLNSNAVSVPPTIMTADLNPHTKLKQFSTICTKSEELLSTVEERLRDMESECTRIGAENND